METTEGPDASQSVVRDDRIAHASSPLHDAVEIAHEFRASFHDQLRLVSIEAQLAARSLKTIFAAAIGIGGLLVSTWLGLLAAGAYGMIEWGLEPAVAMLIGVGLNLTALLVPYGMIRRSRRNLGFPATLHTLQPASQRSGREVA